MRNLAFFIAVTSSLLSACASGEDGLNAVHADIISDHATVAQLAPTDFLKLDTSDVVLLDIREPKEYAVSRLPGAIWINPNASAETALIQMGDVTGKKIVVYCSVGRRSSIFAEREQKALMEMGAVSVQNLERGIFGWHNEKRSLIDANGTTDAVHPYDAVWKRYVERQEEARYTPVPR
ncbi:MAG: rhodanese-like domain-containing protein [Litorimonas sp.]